MNTIQVPKNTANSHIVWWLKTWAMVKLLYSLWEKILQEAGERSRQRSFTHLRLAVCLITHPVPVCFSFYPKRLAWRSSWCQLMFVMLFEDEKDYINAKCKFLFLVSISGISSICFGFGSAALGLVSWNQMQTSAVRSNMLKIFDRVWHYCSSDINMQPIDSNMFLLPLHKCCCCYARRDFHHWNYFLIWHDCTSTLVTLLHLLRIGGREKFFAFDCNYVAFS